MSNPIKNINLSFNCHEDWNKMTPCAGGKFCASCTKTVYDFSEKTLADYQEIITNNKDKVCGRYRYSQLSDKKLHFNFFKRAFSATVLFFGLSMLEAKAQGVGIHEPIPEMNVRENPIHTLAKDVARSVKLQPNSEEGKLIVVVELDQWGKLNRTVLWRGINYEINQAVLSAIDSYYRDRGAKGEPTNPSKSHHYLTFTVKEDQLIWIPEDKE